ncbi:MAG: ABC transporter substrate-binding protein [Nitrospinota bacterium]
MALAVPAWAAEAPVLKELKGPERERVERLIRAAKREGAFLWTTNLAPVKAAKELEKAFKARYGLQGLRVSFSNRRSGTVIKRVEEEIRAGKVGTDLVILATAAWLHSMKRRGELLKYNSPEDKHYGPAAKARMNAPGYWVADAQINTIAWNPKLTGPFKVTSWYDLLNPRFKGKIVVGDATGSETYTFWYMGLRKVLPKSYFEKLAAQGTGLLRRGSAQRRALITGEYWLGTTIMARHNWIARLRGARLEPAYPKEGVVALPIGSVILAKAPHPNVAKLFVDFWRSARGKHILLSHNPINVGYANLPPHPDPEINELVLGKIAPPIEKLNIIPIEWDKLTPKDVKKWRAEFVSILARRKR